MSSHVTAKTLKLLVSKTEDEYDYTYLDHFREKHWGRPGGASVTFDNAGDPRQILCIPTAFSTRVKHPTLVRATYLDLWSNLRQLYLDVPMQNEVVYDATVVWGHPGIGKSVSLFFLMAAAAEAKIPFTYYATGSKYAYVCIDAGSFTIPADLVTALRFTARALVLMDSHTDLRPPASHWNVPSAHLVLATSPAPERYFDIMKERNGRFFTMTLVPLEEFKDMLHLRTLNLNSSLPLASLREAAQSQLASTPAVADDQSMDIDMPWNDDDDDDDAVSTAGEIEPYYVQNGNKFWQPLELYRLLGPNVRSALKPRMWKTGDPSQDLLASAPFERMLTGAVNVLRLLADVPTARPATGASERATGYHRIFFEIPDSQSPFSDEEPNKLIVPTPFLRRVVADAVRSYQETQQIELLNQLRGRGSVHGVVFEAAVIDQLAGKNFKAVLHSSETIIIGPHSAGFVAYPHKGEVLPATDNPPECRDYDPNDKNAIPDEPAFYRLNQGFPSADALIIADGPAGERYEIVLQATVAKAHPIKKRGIDLLTKALEHHGRRPTHRQIFLFVTDTHDKSVKMSGRDYPALKGWEIGSVTLTEKEFLGTRTSCTLPLLLCALSSPVVYEIARFQTGRGV